MDTSRIVAEIDALHQFAHEALERKRFDSYISIFSDNAAYKQLNGKVIDKKQLAKDVAFYFHRIKTSASHYERKDFSIKGNLFTESLTQRATISMRVFLFFTKKWTIEREGIYEWMSIEGTWKIIRVEILHEKVY